MNYASIKKTDIANGAGVRVSLFVSGCTHHCDGCFNPETWDFQFGNPFTTDIEDELIKALAPGHITGLTLLGGEPMEMAHQRVLLPFLQRVKQTYPDKTIWCYTGYSLEPDFWGEGVNPKGQTGIARCEVTDEMLSLIDVMVDGEFVLSKKDIRLKFRGSSNQRVLDVPASIKVRKAVLVDEYR